MSRLTISPRERTSPTHGAPMLQIDGLTKRYGATPVLDGFAMSVAAGEVVSLLGANGSGKSTSLRCVVGLNKPDSGTITVDGTPAVAGRPIPDVAMVFQKIHLVPRRTVIDNVCAGALGRLDLARSWSTLGFPADLREEAMTCLARVGLADRATERAGRLSGGQQQRVAVARALCQRAKVLLADEPVSALDPSAAEQVMRLLRSLADEDGIAVAAVLHQPDLARRHCDRMIGLMHGRTAFDLPAGAVDDATVESLYRPDTEAEL